MRRLSWPKVKVTRSKVKVIYVFIWKIDWAITHEQMDGSWWTLLTWLVMLRGKAFYQIYCVNVHLRPHTTPVSFKWFLPVNHERTNGSWWNFVWCSVMLRGIAYYCIYYNSARLRPRMSPVSIKCLFPQNHERIDYSSRYLHIWLILMSR